MFRNVIQIRAEDSPNVKLGLEEEARGERPSNRILYPGVLTYEEYKERRKHWDKIRQTIGLDAEFYEGVEQLLFPPEWLNKAEARDRVLQARVESGELRRRAKSLGCDPGEGVEDTSWSVIDELGLIERVAEKTTDTSVITGKTIALGKKHNIPPEYWVFDAGGGGRQHADRLRGQGYKVRTVSFGSKVVQEPKWGFTSIDERKAVKEDSVVYFNRRAQMYGELSLALDPAILDEVRFALPYDPELRKQLAPVPRLYDGEGKLWLPPKNRKNQDQKAKGRFDKTMIELIGHSPNDADSLVLAYHGLIHPEDKAEVW